MADHSDLGFTPSGHEDLGFTPSAPPATPSPTPQDPGILSRALTNLPRSAARLIQAYAPGPSSGNLYEELKTHPGEGNPLNPLVAIPRTISAIAHPFLHPQESFAEDPLGTVNAIGLAARGLTGAIRGMPEAMPSIPQVHPIVEHFGERLLHLPRGTVSAMRGAGTAGEEATAAPDLRFQGERTGDVKFRGPIPPVGKPYTPPSNVSWTAGTRGVQPHTTEGVPLKPLGEDLIPQGQAMPTGKATAAQPTANGRPVMLDEKGNPLMYTDTAEPIPMPGKPETAAALKAKFEGPTAGIPADIPERYHVHFAKLGGEVGTREAMAKDSTIANYLTSKKITPEQWEAAPKDQKIAWMKEANPKYRFASGSRSRQEADFTKHVADTMREMALAIRPIGQPAAASSGLFQPPMWPPLPPVLQ